MTQPRKNGRFAASPFANRFAAKFTRGADNECWIWAGAKTNRRRRDYKQGHITADDGSTLIASRAAWIVFRGAIPQRMHVLHTCDNPLCVNPAHLFLGTNADNIADRVKKGRSTVGEKDGFAKLSADQVLAISQSIGTQAAIAQQYGISRSHVQRIRRKETWRHLWNDARTGAADE